MARSDSFNKDDPGQQDQGWQPGATRREFFTVVGAATVAASCGTGPQVRSPGGAVCQPQPGAAQAGEALRVELQVNGARHALLVEPRWSLLYVLRELLGLTAAKAGCERGECGACTVLVDDQPRYACQMLAAEAEGKAVTTLEGLMQGEALGPTQQAFLEQDAFQCGYCTPGQIMAVEGLLRAHPRPTDAQIRLGTSGNLCRCGAYPHILRAARRAAELRAGKGKAG